MDESELRRLAALETDELLSEVPYRKFRQYLYYEAGWKILDWGSWSAYAMDPATNTYEWYGSEDSDKVRQGILDFARSTDRPPREAALEMLTYSPTRNEDEPCEPTS